MGFGPWDLFKLLFSSGNVARHVGKSNWSDFDARYEQRRHEERIEGYINDYKDPELEAEYWAMIEDPEKYDEIWTMLEERRAHYVDICMNRKPISNGTTWEPRDLEAQFKYTEFIDMGRVRLDNDAIKKKVLYVLMKLNGKCPMFCIRDKAEWFYSDRKVPFVPKC